MLHRFFALLLVFLSVLAEAKQTICLNMIIKDESAIITRCLESVKPIIDTWVIIDTGSTDGTQEIVKEYLKDIPGELYERPWRNFGENRTEALELANGKAEYILLIDADDRLVFEEGFMLPELTKDAYGIVQYSSQSSYTNLRIVRASMSWKYVGVTHEYIDCDAPFFTKEVLAKVRYVSGTDGARSKDPKKYWKNVQLLEEGLKKEPDNSRYVFYMAESYRDAGEPGKALEWYQKRSTMGGWEEEVYWSMVQVGDMLYKIGLPSSIVAEAFKLAHSYRPHRAEALYCLVQIYINHGLYDQAYGFLKTHDSVLPPLEKDTHFAIDWMQEYGLLFERSICAYHIGKYQESLNLCDRLLGKNIPEAVREQVKINRAYPVAKLSN